MRDDREKERMKPSRSIMRGIPGDAARRMGVHRIIVPTLGFGVLFGLGVGSVLGAVGFVSWGSGTGLIVFSVLGLALYVHYLPKWVYGYFKGARGEEVVAGELSRLPGEWTIFNGVYLPTGKDVDHIAIGPQGIFIIETKYWKGEVSVGNGQILAEGRVVSRSPIVQVRHALRAIAEVAEVDVNALRGVLCFAGHQFAGNPVEVDEILVCSHQDLIKLISSGATVLDAPTIARVVAHLGGLTVIEGL